MVTMDQTLDFGEDSTLDKESAYMIDKVKDDYLLYICSNCGSNRTVNINDLTCIEDKVISLPKCECGTSSFLNLEADFDELDDDYIEETDMPNKEINNRKYIKDLKDMVLGG